MVVTVHITDINWSKSYYHPGEVASAAVTVHSEVPEPIPASLVVQISDLNGSLARLEQSLTLKGGDQILSITWDPPTDSPHGYGVDLELQSQSGGTLSTASTAFDVLERWTQMPRYGFLTDFGPGRTDAAETMAGLVKYHINALQFYDWMYRHDQFLTAQDPYEDPLGRTLSIKTVNALIDAAHTRGIDAMPYTAIYASSLEFYHAHPDWAMRNADGTTMFFGENFLVYMDPRPDSKWIHYLLDQFDQILEKTAFDGIHLDQYGNPKVAYDSNGQPYDVGAALAEVINATHAHVTALRPNGAVVFNAVTNWPIEQVAPADEDIVYIEVWPPYTTFLNLEQLVVQGQVYGHGKPVVLAAYIDPSLVHNVRLMEALIFASGGGHIELGEHDDMLQEAYFPRYGKMSPALVEILRRDYEFAIRYQNATGPESTDASSEYRNRIQVGSYSSDVSREKDIVLPIVRTSGDYTAVNLVNMLGIPTAEWLTPLPADPTPLGATPVSISDVTRPVAHVWMASPDGEDASLHELPFKLEGGRLSFQIPSLQYWDLILIQWGA